MSKLLALAIRFAGLLRDGIITDQAELARLGHVTRVRVTQIMNLLHLAPDIRDFIRERHVRPIAAVADGRKQRRMWKELREDG